MKNLLLIFGLFICVGLQAQIINSNAAIVSKPAGTNDTTTFYYNGLEQISIKSTGIQFYNGCIKTKKIGKYGYDCAGSAGTYNSRVLDAATLAILSSRWLMLAFNDGSGSTTGGAAVTTFIIPADYQSGTNITLNVDWVNANTSGDAVLNVGFLSKTTNEDLTTASTYLTKQTVTTNGTAYAITTTTFTLTPNTTFHAGDELNIVFYRDGDDAGDNLSGNLLLSTISINYSSNILGQ